MNDKKQKETKISQEKEIIKRIEVQGLPIKSSSVPKVVLLVLEYGPYRKPSTRYSEINMYFEKRLLAIFVDA